MASIYLDGQGRLIKFVEAAGLFSAGLVIQKYWQTPERPFAEWGFVLFMFQYLLARLLDFLSWYRKDRRAHLMPPARIGIEVHFNRGMVPASYLLFLCSLLSLLGLGALGAILGNVIMFAVHYSSVVLIYYYFTDHDSLPVNYFTQNLHLRKPLDESGEFSAIQALKESL